MIRLTEPGRMTGSLNNNRTWPGATSLPDGTVLVAGGGNPGGLEYSMSSAELFPMDDPLPVVRVEQGVGQPDPTNTSPIVFDVTFSEEVTGFGSSDVDFTAAPSRQP